VTGRRATLPLYLGGFLGPFGGAVLAVLIPELRDAFHATTDQVALAVPAYLVPFALLQVVSGTIGERIGRRRAVRAWVTATGMAGLWLT
jgi:MFS family permease